MQLEFFLCHSDFREEERNLLRSQAENYSLPTSMQSTLDEIEAVYDVLDRTEVRENQQRNSTRSTSIGK